MIEIKTKLKKWGNSFGIVVPQNILDDNIKENEEITVFISKTNPNLKKLFGKLKNWEIDAQKFKDDVRENEPKIELFS